MILTCPECASRYFVDDARIGPEGRKVRCAACGHAWRETAPLDVAPLDEAMSFAPVDAGASEPEASTKRGARADVSTRLREAAAEKRKTREAAAVGVTWAVLAAGFCALGLVAVIFKTDVVRLMPVTAGAYAFARMPVNPVGIAIEGVAGSPGLQDGRATLKVSGVERNIDTRPHGAAPLRVSLFDKAGVRITSQLAQPPAGPIQPGETRAFTAVFLDPPLQAASAQAEFAFDAMQAASHPPAPTKALARQPVMGTPPGPLLPSDVLKLRGSADVQGPAPATEPAKDVQPLPASSPYALPQPPPATHG